MAPFPDDRYDVFIVDATDVREAGESGDTGTDALSLDLAIVAGPLKGEMLSLTARGLGRDAIEVLGLPGTLTVTDGVPHLRLDG